jgi:DNA-binding response OmpR family regulator
MTQPVALIVEDDKKLAKIFQQALKMAGFETEVAQDGRVALAQLAMMTPAVIVLDLHLPYVSGREVLKEIRANPNLRETRVILATADPAMADTLQDQADLVLIKPISFGQLRDMAARLKPGDPT